MHTLSSFTGKTLLVTGATGFIGRALARRLQEHLDTTLVLLSRKPRREVADSAVWVDAPLDQLSRETWRTSGVERIDVVFHLAAFTPKSGAAADSVEEVYRDNLLGTRSLLESLPSPPERIVFASTLDVYAPLPEGGVLTESSPLAPANLYAASKLFCEQLIRAYAQAHGCRSTILRYGHIFGPGEEAYQKLIPQTIRQLLQGEAPVLYGDGSAERDFLYVDDAVEATLRAAVLKEQLPGPINIVRGSSRPIRDIVEMLVDIAGFSGNIRFLADRPSGQSLRFDNRGMRESLGVWPYVSLEDGLRREVDYFKGLHQ